MSYNLMQEIEGRMMYYISKKFTFEAAHFIPNHPKCGKVHGHSFKVQISLGGRKLNKDGMLIDFAAISNGWKLFCENVLDHQMLNDSLVIIPTAEHLAKWIFTRMSQYLDESDYYHVKVYGVKVWETEDNMAMYMED